MWAERADRSPGVYVVQPSSLRGLEAGVRFRGATIPLERWRSPDGGYYPGLCTAPVQGRVWRTPDFPEQVAEQMLGGVFA